MNINSKTVSIEQHADIIDVTDFIETLLSCLKQQAECGDSDVSGLEPVFAQPWFQKTIHRVVNRRRKHASHESPEELVHTLISDIATRLTAQTLLDRLERWIDGRARHVFENEFRPPSHRSNKNGKVKQVPHSPDHAKLIKVEPHDHVSAIVNADQLTALASAMMEKLSVEEHRLIFLRYFEGSHWGTIAREMGISLPACHSIHHHALKILRMVLEKV